jgi:putative ABC transport system permease protein
MLVSGTDEAIVGKGAKVAVRRAETWAIRLCPPRTAGRSWGLFEAGGGVAESEIWCDVQNLQNVYHRTNGFSVVLAKRNRSSPLADLMTG